MKKLIALALIVIVLASTSPVRADAPLPRYCLGNACGTPVCWVLEGPERGTTYLALGTVPGFITCRPGDLLAIVPDYFMPIVFN
ncbi:MAG TPA: hypothetical protein VGM23_04350 [Armatimonadota bacterium]|jgi:hypothetical protein